VRLHSESESCFCCFALFRPADSVRVLEDTVVLQFKSPPFPSRLSSPLTTMTETRITPQDFQPIQRHKRKRSQLAPYSEPSTSFLSPNQFAILSDSEPEEEEEESKTQPKSPAYTNRIPPIVLYSLLDNHSAPLKRVNEKLTTPVDVKSKADRLLLYTKSSTDFKILLSEIQTAKLAYHTYPLPEAVQPRLVLKGVPFNVPEEDIRTELVAHDVQVTRISQLSKTDKSTNTVITKYPIFVITFPPGSDIHKVLQIRKLCHCIVKWEKLKNSRPVRQCFNCQAFGHSSNYCGKPPRCVKCDQPHTTKDCTKPVDIPPKCVNCGGEHPANFTGCPRYQQQLHYNSQTNNQRQQQPRKPNPTVTSPQYQRSTFPPLRSSPPQHRPPQTWAQITPQSPKTTNQQPLSSTVDSIKAILNMFDFHKLSTLLRSLTLQLQEANDPVAKLVAIIDTVVAYLSSSP